MTAYTQKMKLICSVIEDEKRRGIFRQENWEWAAAEAQRHLEKMNSLLRMLEEEIA